MADTAVVEINQVPDNKRSEEIMDYFCIDVLYDACASTLEKTLAIGEFVADNIPHDNQKEYPEYVNAIGLWEYTKTVAPAFNCRQHSIMTYELLMAAGVKARYITCLPYGRKGNLLSLAEIREHFINDEKEVVYYNFDDPTSKISYYHAYMAKNTYWFCCWGGLVFYQEDYKIFTESKLRSMYYALVPEGVETFTGKDITTNDPGQF